MAPLLVTPPIRILAVAVSPSDLDGLDVERERTRLNAAMEAIQAKGLVELTWVPGQTWQDFTEALWEGPWHILHFIGHGGFDENRQEGIVAFARPDGKADYKRATSLGRILGDHEPLRLAVLNACDTGRSDVTDVFSSTAGTLVRKGTPAVVAMQYEITDEAAIELSRSFYGAVARGIPVDTALTEARKGVATAFEDTLEWGTPVLYLQTPDGVLFDITAAPIPTVAAAAAAAAAGTIAAAGTVAVPPVAPPVEPPSPEPPTTEPIPTPEPVRTTEPEPPEPGSPIPVPPRPPSTRFPLALAAGGGAAALVLVLVANILGGGGAGESASPSSAGSAAGASSVAVSEAPPSTEVSPSGAPSSEVPPSGPDTLLASGRGILFQCYTGDSTNSPTSEIYLYDPESTQLEQITDDRSPDRWPRWSRDGKLFAFTRLTREAGDIWTMNTGDRHEEQLTNGTSHDSGPDVAGSWVYFNSNRTETNKNLSDIWRVARNGDGDPEVYFGQTGALDSSPAWSEDGTTMAFSSSFQVNERAIYTTDTDKNDKRRTSGDVIDRNPTWKLDGTRLLFTRNAGRGPRDIYSLAISGGTPTRVSSDPADEGGPVYSPDGKQIAFYRKVDNEWHLLIGDLDDQEVLVPDSVLDVTTTKSLEGNCIDPSWR